MLVLNEPNELRSLDDDRHSFLCRSDFTLFEFDVAHEVLLSHINVEHLNLPIEIFDFISLVADSFVKIRIVF